MKGCEKSFAHGQRTFRNLSLTVQLPCSRFVGLPCRIWKQRRSNSKRLRNRCGGRLKVTQKLPQKFSENFIQPREFSRGGASTELWPPVPSPTPPQPHIAPPQQ